MEQTLADVSLHLREVRIDSAVECEVLANSPAHITAELSLLLIVAPVADWSAIGVSRHCRRRFENEPTPQVVQSVERPRLGEEVCVGANRRRPAVLKSGVLNATK